MSSSEGRSGSRMLRPSKCQVNPPVCDILGEVGGSERTARKTEAQVCTNDASESS